MFMAGTYRKWICFMASVVLLCPSRPMKAVEGLRSMRDSLRYIIVMFSTSFFDDSAW